MPFSLLLEGESDLTDELEDRVYEAGFDDGLLSSKDGKVSLYLAERRSPQKAIRELEKAGFKAVVEKD